MDGWAHLPTVTKHVHLRMQTLANRLHDILVDRGLIPADTDRRNMLVAVEMADRVLELSYRDNSDFDGTSSTSGARRWSRSARRSPAPGR